MKQLASTLILILLLHATSAFALPDDFLPELAGTHGGGFGQLGSPTADGTLMFGEHQFTLGGVDFRSGDKLVVWFVGKERGVGTELEFPFVKEHISGASAVWKPLIIGEKKYTAELFRYGKIFRVLVKLYKGDRVVSGIQWVCAEPTKAERRPGVTGKNQACARQPATAPESKAEGKKKPQPESKGRSQ